MGGGDDGLSCLRGLDQAAVLGGEVGVVFEDGAASTLDKGLAQDAVGKRVRPLRRFPGTLVVVGAAGRPGGGMAGGWEACHAAAQFGDDGLGGAGEAPPGVRALTSVHRFAGSDL